MTLVSTKESKVMLNKYEDLWTKTTDQIKLIIYDEKYIKIKLNSNNYIP